MYRFSWKNESINQKVYTPQQLFGMNSSSYILSITKRLMVVLAIVAFISLSNCSKNPEEPDANKTEKPDNPNGGDDNGGATGGNPL
jgi:preprotein translocase subunit SecG